MKGCNGRTDLRILWGEHNHTGTQSLQLFPEKEDYTTGKTESHPLGEKQANDWSGLPIWWRNIRLPIYSPKRLGHMGKQQTAGQSLCWKGGWEKTKWTQKIALPLGRGKLPPIFTSHILYPTSIDSTNFNNKATVTVWNESWLNNLCAFSISIAASAVTTLCS